MDQEAKDAITTLLKSVLGDVASAELVEVKQGQTIEEIIAGKGLTPVGDKCGGCGNHHNYVNAAGERVVVMPVNESEEVCKPEDKPDFPEKQRKALEGLRRRQAVVLRMYDILRDMERSIEQRKEDRDLGDLLGEIGMFMELRQLAREVAV